MALRMDKHRKIAEEAEAESRSELLGSQPEKAERTGPFKPFGKLTDAVSRSLADRSQAGSDRAQDNIQDVLHQIAVIAFIGPSGTGKSTRAIKVARENNIHYLIDDGLLIHGSQIVAGSSAKKAASRLDSVRQALFADETRAAVVRRALAAERPAALMILGTSDGMLEKICQNLWLNPPAMLIRIEDVSTDEEIRKAKETRLSEGKHTIPVPSMEIKHEFSGTLSIPLSRMRRRRDKSDLVAHDSERTVVRPTFSSLGNYSISDEAMRMMIELILRRIRGVHSLLGFEIVNEIAGVSVNLDLALVYGFNAPQVLQEVQERISRQVEEYTSINVMSVNVRARRVVHAAVAQTGSGSESRSS
jgi:uncharacterized alkaline shock family protein YloU/adenylate kinase family enzyme